MPGGVSVIKPGLVDRIGNLLIRARNQFGFGINLYLHKIQSKIHEPACSIVDHHTRSKSRENLAKLINGKKIKNQKLENRFETQKGLFPSYGFPKLRFPYPSSTLGARLFSSSSRTSDQATATVARERTKDFGRSSILLGFFFLRFVVHVSH